jgi:GNAT superfamily N-acetyltransferase
MKGPSPMNIRLVTGSDVSDVVAACEWLFAPPGAVPAQWDPAACAVRLRELISSPSAACFVAVDDVGLVIGFVTVYLDLNSIRRGQRSWINELAVHPEHRSRGIGKALLHTAMGWAQDHGATHVALDSSVSRTDAHRFYLREQPDWRAEVFGWDLAAPPTATSSRPQF